MISDRGLASSVVVAGFQTNPYPWYRKAGGMVLSSDREGMPNVLLEALALGTAVASTDCPSGPFELLGEERPECLAPPGDPEALAKAMLSSLDRVPDSAGEILRPFSPEVVTAQVLQLCTGR
jgi:glycosyltransferase involved in cell wall biosynthesis